MTTADNKLFKMTEYTNKFYGYYFYQLDPTGNKLHVRVRTTNDRSRPPHPHMIACGIIKFMSRGQPVVTAYHLYPANNARRTYIDDTRAVDLARRCKHRLTR